MHETFVAPEWFEALTLIERAALLGVGDVPPPEPGQAERAARKAARWRSECDLLDDAVFAERLALEGLTPERFLRILAEPAAWLQRRAGRPPAWVEELAAAFSGPVQPLPAAADRGDLGLGILELLRPVIAQAHVRVLDRLCQIGRSGTPLDPATLAVVLLDTLLRRLRWASERVLVLEIHAARLEGRLQGETPEDRFASFVASLREPATALEILRRYPVLARDACRHAAQWAETSLEMIERFAADRPEIVACLGWPGEDPGPLVAAETGLSDRHAGGRSVAILTFASGFRVVYKP